MKSSLRRFRMRAFQGLGRVSLEFLVVYKNSHKCPHHIPGLEQVREFSCGGAMSRHFRAEASCLVAMDRSDDEIVHAGLEWNGLSFNWMVVDGGAWAESEAPVVPEAPDALTVVEEESSSSSRWIEPVVLLCYSVLSIVSCRSSSFNGGGAEFLMSV
ncbi:hypothetical protein Tco_0528148 [Tanacetum coccineum]